MHIHVCIVSAGLEFRGMHLCIRYTDAYVVNIFRRGNSVVTVIRGPERRKFTVGSWCTIVRGQYPGSVVMCFTGNSLNGRLVKIKDYAHKYALCQLG